MKSLNLTLLVDTEHYGVDRRLQVKAHDVANFFDQLGSGESEKLFLRWGCNSLEVHSSCIKVLNIRSKPDLQIAC